MTLKVVFLGVGETLVDEERWWRTLAERSTLQPHVVWAALGVTIARGEEHGALWGHLGIERPDTWWEDLSYDLDDLYPDAIPSLEAVQALGLRTGIVGNLTAALERWAREAALPADFISSSARMGVRKPDRRSSRGSSSLPAAPRARSPTWGTASTTTSSRRWRRGSSPCTYGEVLGVSCRRLPQACLRSTPTRSFPKH